MKKTRSTPLSIFLLGPFRVSVTGRPVAEAQWARPQGKLLLKLLALEPRHQLHRQQIMDAIWPDLDETSAAANLHKIIHMARRALEPGLKSAADSRFIQTRDQSVQLPSDGLWVDVEEFESASIRAFRSGKAPDCEAALSLYGGDLLSEDLYADWCARRRDQLRASYHELLMKLGALCLNSGGHSGAIEQFEKLVASEPSNEEAHRELMRLYVLTGRRSEALRQYQRCSDAVRRELDTEPEESTLELYRKILSKEIRALPQKDYAGGMHAPLDTIAVLPFHNDTGDSSLAYLSSGIAEGLIKNLSRLTKLRVLAYSTVARYKGRDLNPRKLGRVLGARALATGRVAQLHDALTVTAELVDTSDGSVLWGEQYKSRQKNVLAIQEEMARAISAQLKLQFTVDERRQMAKQHTTDPEAYTLYLKGRFHWNKRTGEGFRKAIEYFQNAIRKDASYALAYSGLADCYSLVSLYSVMPPKQAMPKAKDAARKALKIDSSLAEAHTSLALIHLYYDWDWKAAEHEFQQAIALNPNYATAHHWYHEHLTAMGRFEEQMAEILHAEELDPLSLIINTDVGWGLYFARKYGQAIEQLRRTLELDSNFAVAHLMLGLAHAQENRLDEAQASIQRSLELLRDDPLTLAIGALGYVHAVSGRKTEARAVIKRLSELKQLRYASEYCQAMVLAGLGENAAAIKCLERAFIERYDRLIYLKVEPIFDVLRNEPAFRSLLRRMDRK